MKLLADLRGALEGRTCVIGVGNVDWSDDGIGVRLAEDLAAAGYADVVVGGMNPERYLGRVLDKGYDHVLFLDAVVFSDGSAEHPVAPGTTAFLDSTELQSRFPQVSTHKISLGLMAQWVETEGTAKAWVLGIEPGSIRPSTELTPEVQETREALFDALCEVLQVDATRTINSNSARPEPVEGQAAIDPPLLVRQAHHERGDHVDSGSILPC